MKLLAIETSCDETAVAVVETHATDTDTTFTILGDALISQIELHREYGGVYPSLAKREHAKNLVPVLCESLKESGLLVTGGDKGVDFETISFLFEREPELFEALKAFLGVHSTPDVDAIAVTYGPGLPPALWLGVNMARALSIIWNKPLVGINHMEGHLLSGLGEIAGTVITLPTPSLPLLALLISGGHTELVSMNPFLSYELLGQTKDDAVGEAFDKVARMMGLTYPGGPEISRLAEQTRSESIAPTFSLPRPMIHEPHLDFSFSGLKTAVMYHIKKHGEMNENDKKELALEFENAVTEVLWKKTMRALEDTGAKTLVLGGGVSANTHIRRTFTEHMAREFPDVSFNIPGAKLTTDNALMIAIAGYFRAERGLFDDPNTLQANGNLTLA
jgi:N6-L-threonylcarbamoyladenine synthase